MSYSIYRLTSPSGKVYIGVSKNVKERWRSHVRKSKIEDGRHPLYDAIRSYGHDAFRIETLHVLENRDAALSMEILEIAIQQTTKRSLGYNISPGGEYDCTEGAKKFWETMRSDPTAFAAYRAKLCLAQQKRSALGLITCPHLVALNAALPPRERWRRAYRASRISRKTPRTRSVSRPLNSGNPKEVKAAWEKSPRSKKVRHAIGCRERAKRQWADRTEKEVAEISEKISASVKNLHNDPLYRENNLRGLEKGRVNMDRRAQGAAASKGLKNFWASIKEDPLRYAEYLSRRNASLKNTLISKGLKCEE